MSWGTVELEPEVTAWIDTLSKDDVASVAFYVDLLADTGVLLGEPFTRQLRRKLRELRFHLGSQQIRITYYIATGRRIVLLTVFTKSRQHEAAEIVRAYRQMERCIAEGHTVEDEDE